MYGRSSSSDDDELPEPDDHSWRIWLPLSRRRLRPENWAEALPFLPEELHDRWYGLSDAVAATLRAIREAFPMDHGATLCATLFPAQGIALIGWTRDSDSIVWTISAPAM